MTTFLCWVLTVLLCWSFMGLEPRLLLLMVFTLCLSVLCPAALPHVLTANCEFRHDCHILPWSSLSRTQRVRTPRLFNFLSPVAPVTCLHMERSALQVSDWWHPLPLASGSSLPFLSARVPLCERQGQTGKGPGPEGAGYTHLHQGLFDNSADVSPPLRNVRVVIVQVWRKGQAKRSEFLCGPPE